jgi:hypothetical protein
MRKLIFGLSIILLFASCIREEFVYKNENNFTGDYQPMTAGSKWAYDGSYNYSVEAIQKDTIIKGRTFHGFSSSVGERYFMSIDENNNYYLYASNVASLGGIQNVEPLVISYLKGNAEVNSTWTIPYITDFFDATYQMTIKEKGIEYTVNNVLYKNVIKVEMVTSVEDFPELSSTTINYYAKNIGLIYSEMTSGQPGTNFNKVIKKLKSYSIK